MTKNSFTTDQVHHIASLANIPVSAEEEITIASAFAETLGVITNLTSLDTVNVSPTAQTTGLENVTRDDIVKPDDTLSQADALANAANTANGYFLVERILHHDQ